ncbi:Serine/threonine-protein kinase, partial [Recurvomyces mirabilis]
KSRSRSTLSSNLDSALPPIPQELDSESGNDNTTPTDMAGANKSSGKTGSSSNLDPASPTSPPLLPHERHTLRGYPTPPLSHSSSLANMGKDIGDADSPLNPSPLSRNPSSIAVSRPETAAGHISNPAGSPNTPANPSVAHGSLCSVQEKAELIQERAQNTPPQTPRSGSHESRRDGEDVRHVPRADKSSRSSSGNPNVATVGQIKGQLEVSVEEGRGLKPSVEPYVVCIFQLNEAVSRRPQEDQMDTAIDNDSEPEQNLAKGVAMKRLGSGSGTPMAIPGMRSRQTSSTNIADLRRGSKSEKSEVTDPVWRHKTLFDVVGENNEMDISVYDRARNEEFLGHVRLPLNLEQYEHQHADWYKLQPRQGDTTNITGEVHLRIAFHASGKKTFGPEDFEVLKLIGKGTFGQVFQVRKRDSQRIYAMKVLSKKVIIQKKEIQHTIGERNILVRTATTESPFIVALKFSFQTAADLYLVTDYMSGGELFWHLQKEGRFVEERAKFYIAELILALRHLHQHNIVYRDLKPENILLDANGHVALCDFGLSKANLSKDDTTNTFCGTTEYLAPEVLLDEQGYTKMVDFWSLGVLVFEMCCGWSPFYAEDTQQMYKNIAFGKVRFPRDALSQEGRNFVKGLLNRNPSHRLGAKGDAEELMAHPFFNDVDWTALSKKLTPPPFKPKLKGELDTSNFDPEFTNALTSGDMSSSLNARAAALASGVGIDNTPLSPTMQNQFRGFTFVDESTLEQQFADRDVGMTDSVSSTNGRGSRGDRMSGVEPSSATSAHGDSDFNHGMLEDI